VKAALAEPVNAAALIEGLARGGLTGAADGWHEEARAGVIWAVLHVVEIKALLRVIALQLGAKET
jgi:hypothetical protein